MLCPIVFNGQFHIWVVQIKFQVLSGDGVLQEIRSGLDKGFLEIEFHKRLAHLFPLATGRVGLLLMLSLLPQWPGLVDWPEQYP